MEKTSYTPGFLPRDIERADGDSLLSNFWKSQSVSPQEDSPRRETEQEMRRLPLSAEAAVPSCQRFLKLHSGLHPTHSPHHSWRFCKPGGATLFPALQGCPPVVDKLHSLSLPCTALGLILHTQCLSLLCHPAVLGRLRTLAWSLALP